MTDNEIIKAAKDCKEKDIKLFDELVALIGRQRIEILNLHMKSNRLQRLLSEAVAENKKFEDIGKMHSEVKAEAIKEFFEKTKQLNVTVAFPDGGLKTAEEMKEWVDEALKRVSVAINDIKDELLSEWGINL